MLLDMTIMLAAEGPFTERLRKQGGINVVQNPAVPLGSGSDAIDRTATRLM